MTTVYTIGVVESYQGHGDFHEELVIKRQGAYGTGDWHPVFQDREDAEAYLKANVPEWHKPRVVALPVHAPASHPETKN